jgi:hypothetical protein
VGYCRRRSLSPALRTIQELLFEGMKKPVLFLSLLLFCFVWSAQSIDDAFRKYWYQQKAELTRYALKQARYGEIHQGEAVLIFVTEPFLTDKQVKYEQGDKSKSLSVLKLNFTRKFYTGIYPYSLMTSIFTPVDFQKQHTLKITSSSQEWCGNTFSQMNWRDAGYDVSVRSYFQDEGDQNFKIPQAWLEDELWTRIRLAPESLPVGNFEIVPGLQFVRMWHKEAKPVKASAKLTEDGNLRVYSLEYPSIKRQLIIRFNKNFPYEVESWEETQPGGFGDSAPLTTKAVKTNRILLDYWNRHGVEDAHYRKELGLTEH